MFLSSWFRRFGQRPSRQTNKTYVRRPKSISLSLERLEARELLAGVPLITAVTPSDGSTTLVSTPNLTVTFNEDVTGANVAANFSLFDSTGIAVPISAAIYTKPVGGPFVTTLSYNAGEPLDSGTYTLFVRGDKIIDATGSNLPLAQPGQLVVANSGKNNVSTVAFPGDGTLNAMTNYPYSPFVTPAQAFFIDVTGDGINDLIVTDTAPNTNIDIFVGQANGVYHTTPDAVLPLQTTSAVGLVVGDLDKDGNLDIVTSNAGLNNISVYMSTGPLQFAAPVNIDVGPNPRNVVIDDFNGDTKLDVAVPLGGTALDLDNDMVNDYYVAILPGIGDGTFGTAVNVKVGDTSGVGLRSPTGLGKGLFNNDAKMDLVATGTGGIAVLANTSTTVISFTSTLVAAANTFSAGGVLFRSNNAVASQAVDISSTTGAPNQIIIFQNNGTGTFTARPPIMVGTNLSRVRSQDVDGDGLNDIEFTNNVSPGQVSVLRNLTTPGGQITFAATAKTFAVEDNPIGFDFLDTDQDGKLDIVSVSGNNRAISVLRGNGDGTYKVSTELPVTPATQPDAVAVGDVNGDGRPDLVAADAGTNQVSIFLALAAGGYGPATTVSTLFNGVGRSPASVVLVDLTGTGKLDIVTASRTDGVVTVLSNNGSGVFTVFGTAPTGNTPVKVLAGDFDGNGKPDLAVAHSGALAGGGVSAGVTILLSNGNRTFQPGTEIATSLRVSSLALGDFNKDGKLDVVVADNNAPGRVAVLLGDGAGNFNAPSFYSVAINPNALAVADVNDDGYADIIAGSGSQTTSGNISVLLNAAGGGFSPSVSTTIGNGVGVQDVTVAYINQDAFPDIVITASRGLITGATNASPIVITSANHGLFTGQVISVAGVLGNTAANGATWTVTVLDNNRFSLNLSTGTGGYTSGGVWSLTPGATVNNVFTLTGVGDGKFINPSPYQVGGSTAPSTIPSFVAVVSDPFRRASTFTIVGPNVNSNLIRNGDFEATDLSGEQGNLNGWTTFDLGGSPGSRGRWMPQTGLASPVNGIAVQTSDNGFFQAILDEADLIPFLAGTGPDPNLGINANFPSDYSGSHALYQDIAIPATAKQLTLSFTIFIDNSYAALSYSDTTVTSELNFNTLADNQQVRVDLVNPNAPVLETALDNPATNTVGVYKNLFVTDPTQDLIQEINQTLTLDTAAFAGKTIRLRIAATNNRGLLVVGVDDVKLQARFSDTIAPTLAGVVVRNVSSVSGPSVPDATTDPTIVGTVSDNGSINNLAYIEIDPKNNGFGLADDIKIVNWDANGNFSFTIPTNLLLPGKNTIALRAVDKAGNQVVKPIDIVLQGPSDVVWSAQDRSINTTTQFVDFPTVSGNITAVVADPRDSSGNTYYVGAANGGVWKTTDGGRDWRVLTDNIKDANGQPVPAWIGGLALGINPNPGPGQPSAVLYAGTGISDNTRPNTPGVGILKSIDGGLTWTLLGQKIFTGARVAKVVIDPTNINVVYVAVTSFVNSSQAPGLYRTIDGGLTWINVLKPSNMYLPGRTGTLAANTLLASVTDIVPDPFTGGRLLIGLGNIGQAPASITAGVWRSTDGGTTWDQIVGGADAAIPNNSIPTGITVGRVTIGMGSGRVGDEKYVYVLMGTPPPALPPINIIDQGTMLGLFKSKDNMLNFTKVMLKQQKGAKGTENFVDINLLGHGASDVGAVLVDSTNPNVVYVGGSNLFPKIQASFKDPPNHGIVRIDTGNMRDTTYIVGSNTIPNDGDDITKALIAATASNPRKANQYDPPAGQQNGVAYTGEGVYWYDMTEASADTDGLFVLLPSGIIPPTDPLVIGQSNYTQGIHVLTFDSQGRLLVGTESGIYRAISFGYGYDLTGGDGTSITSNMGGITGGATAPYLTPGPFFTAINGNLQIAELTAVAIDPVTPTTLYASAYGTGTSVTTTGPLGWLSSGLIGPTSNSIIVTGSPNATMIRVGAPDPTAASGAPATVYRVWQVGTVAGNFPEMSTDGGISFAPVALAGIDPQEDTGTVPAFAINPNKVFLNGVPHDQLLYGTRRVFRTTTGTNVWDPISPVLSQNGYISALAFAPGNPGLYYAGTTDGQIFVETPIPLGGQDPNWPKRNTGLPGNPGTATAPQINNIVVDPNNGAIAFALLDGIGNAHVYKTIDGGAHWLPSNTLVGGGTLPDVPAYSMLIDARPAPGAAFGRYYLGTAYGVYVSLDKGVTWLKFGQGLPTVPVVDLQFNASQEMLVAATRGRGVFEISTRTAGPQVASITPATPVNQALTQVTVTFNEVVDPRTLSVNFNTSARVTLANNLLFTDSYRTNRVTSLYQQYLRRTPVENIQGPVTLLQQQGEEQVVSFLISSAEYFSNPALGNNSNATWINQIYLDLLHRTAAGDAGAANMLAALNLNTVTRTQIANALVASTEFRGDEVAALYNQLLGRNKPFPASPTDPEIAAWLPLLLTGTRIEALMANLLGSQEYYLNNDGQLATGVGSQPVATALANLSGNKDANGTPIADLLVVNKGTNTVSIFQGRAGGGYAATATLTLTLPAGAAPRGIAVGDFNNDNKPDVAVVNSGTDNVTVFLNNSTAGGISFVSNTGTNFSVGAGSGPVAIVAAKINADSNLDLAVVSSKAVSNNFNLYILIGAGTGAFGTLTTVSSALTVPLSGVAAGDVNGDNVTDFVISANDGGGTGGLRLLRATGTLAYAGSTLTTLPASSVALAKIDTNTSLDIVALQASSNNVLVLQNQGGSPVVFGAPLTFPAGTLPGGAQVADLNGDGRSDVVVFNSATPGNVTTLLNTTAKATSGFDTITFGAGVTYPVQGGKPVALTLGDTNGDLVADAVLAIQGNDSVFVLPGTNQGSFVMPTDERFVTSLYKRLTGVSPTLSSLNASVQTLGQAEQTRLTGPGGSTVPLAIVDINNAHLSFLLTFAPQTADGTYTLTVGPNTLQNQIKDFVDISGTYQNLGLPLNQNNNTVSGEFPGDRYVGQLAINTSDNGRFVTGMYHDLLGAEPTGRQADAVGFINALAPVDAAQFAVLGGMAPVFTTSSEYRSLLVQSYYGKYLRRSPLPAAGGAEVQAWVTYLNNAQVTEEGIIAAFVGSPEYFGNPAIGNSNNATWLNQAYLDLLGRGTAGDANAAAILIGLNNATVSRSTVVNNLVTSDEFLRRIIFADYVNLVGRAPHDSTDPSQSEFAALLPILKQKTFAPGGPSPDEQLINALVGSHEYFQHVGNTDRAWAASMYSKVLGRASVDPNGVEVSNLVVAILNGFYTSRQTAAATLLATAEHKARLVGSYYQDHLGRAATSVEITTWVGQMPPLSDEQVLANIVSSAEYFPTSGGGSSNSGWLDKLFNDLLKRTSAGDTGASGFLNLLNSTPPAQIVQARISVALSVLRSTEYRRILVASFFNKYLTRTKPIPPVASDPDLVGYVNLLNGGATQEQIIAILIGSAEYDQLPHTFP